MSSQDDFFNKFKDALLNIDPVMFSEKYLTLDGQPFRLSKNGYRPFADIYRYIGIKALEPDAKPVILVKGRQVGATTMASALEMYFMGCGRFGVNGKPPIRIIHAWPQLALAAGYSKTKFSSMISGSVLLESSNGKRSVKSQTYMQSLLDKSAASGDSQHFKQFQNGNHIWIESTGLDADRLRSKTADVMFFDEIQDIPGLAISNAVKILSKAKYGPVGEGIQIYLGTPKQRGSTYYQMWQASSQQYYHLGCEKCEKHFPLYTPGSNEWEKIWLYGFIVKCIHCGHEQDKRDAAERGKWISMCDNNHDTKMIGFHINQLYMPDFPKEKIIAEKPENHPFNTERAYQNEVLGEFFHGEAGIITPEQIIDKCGDRERKFRANIMPNEKIISFLGIDIGLKSDVEQLIDSKRASQGQSYSTAVVLSIIGPGLLQIDRALKFQKNDLQSKKGIVEELMKQYSINLGVCDIGFAQDFNEIMQQQFGERFLSSMVAGKLNEHIKYDGDVFPKLITFEKDFYISELFEQFKKGNIRFPLGNYEQISWLIQHCTSMEIKPTMSRTGNITAHYVKGTTPNDGFMALLNAYLAYKFYVSNGFSIKNPLLFNQKVENKPLILGAYLPKMR